MKFMKTTVLVLVVLLIGMGFLACVDQTALPLGTEAQLLGLNIGSVRISSVPAPISPTAWESESGLGLYDEDFQSAQFNRESEITSARIRPNMSRDATAEWGIGSRTVRPGEFYDTRVPATFESDEFIYLRVTSGDKLSVNYYRYHAKVFSWVTDLASVTIKEREAKAAVGTGKLDNLYGILDTNAMMGVISVIKKEAIGAVIEPKTFDTNAKVRFAKATGNAVPSFQAPTTPITFTDQDFLYVEVTAENTVDKTYFKFRVNVGRIAAISSLIFTTTTGDVELYGTGLPNSQWPQVGPGEYKTAAVNQPGAGFDIKITLEEDDPGAKYLYKVASSKSTALTNDNDYNSTRTKFNNNDWLLIMVKAPNGNIKNYYHIQVTLLAGNVKAQPKSTWYKKGATAAPLTIEFEPGTNTAGFTYQWYESDSLFGIYGRHGVSMDEKNNISTINGGPDMYYYLVQPGINQYGGDIVTTIDNDKPETNPDNPKYLEALAWEADVSRGAKTASFTPRTDWEDVPIRLPLDATQNNSFPVRPDSELYNADFPAPVGSTYDPSDKYHLGPNKDSNGNPYPQYGDNKVNFFTGSTSEVRYYWVVVTDPSTGLTVTSDRAVILTETNASMDHYIFELSILPRKNVVPFKVLRELYTIPFPADYFPDGFDPTKYDVCIAQAQYYLPDGRPWTQNWTHGDLHFGYTEGSASYKANGGPLTWWHNNLGSNSGAIPLHTPHAAQGGLGFQPDWVGFAPSGDKARGLPPLDKKTGKLPVGYKPEGYTPEGAAQGYFCGFIELMELRFATKPSD